MRDSSLPCHQERAPAGSLVPSWSVLASSHGMFFSAKLGGLHILASQATSSSLRLLICPGAGRMARTCRLVGGGKPLELLHAAGRKTGLTCLDSVCLSTVGCSGDQQTPSSADLCGVLSSVESQVALTLKLHESTNPPQVNTQLIVSFKGGPGTPKDSGA